MATDRPKRLLVVAPSWVGDAAMATPAMSALRAGLPGAFIGALVRPGIDRVLDGTRLSDETHVDRAAGVMGPKRVAQKLRARRYDAAVLLPNSFSTALIARLAWIRQRFGYERDGRALLLTHGLTPPRRRDTPPFDADTANANAWAPIPACDYYLRLAHHALAAWGVTPPDPAPMRLAVTDEDRAEASSVLGGAGLALDELGERGALLLNPGGNNPAKRWPPDRFAAVADHAHERHGWITLVNGSPAEAELAADVAGRCAGDAVPLPAHGVTLGALKAIVAASRAMVTNDTGPRHLAAALGVPVVSLFGPTDHRWTTIPFQREAVLEADPDLPAHLVANDHPDRCAIERITVERAIAALDSLSPGA